MALNTGGVQKFRDFGPIIRYISQMIQDSAIVTLEGKGTRMRSIKWCHFQ